MPDATITTYQDGPLIVRGDVQILSEDGHPIDAGRTTMALCRCGKSGAKPFCDGTHALARFRAPGGRQVRDAGPGTSSQRPRGERRAAAPAPLPEGR